MGSLGSSDCEEEQRGSPCISKRRRIPKKLSDDFIPVDYALVPRKLRSVKKRSSGLVSSKLLISKKHKLLENGDKLWGKNGLKKLKPSAGIAARPGRHVITKDEEEVAETLYALADMFPETTKDMTKMTGEPSKLEEAFSNMEMSGSRVKVVPKNETESRIINSAGTETNNQSSNAEESAQGLETRASNFSKSSTSKNSIISRPQSFENLGSLKKVASTKPWKKSCTHVHISNLIVELKKADTLQMQSTQTAHLVELNRGAFATSNTSNENTNKVFPFISTSEPAQTSSNEIRNAVLLHKRLLEDQQHAVSASQFFTLQNQNLDFFNLLAGGSRGESSHCSAKVDHLPYLQSKNHQAIPFLLPPDYYPTNSSTWQPRQQHNWCDQLTEPWKGGRISESNAPNLKKGVQDGPSLLHFAPFFSPSHSSLGVFGQNYAPRQQQQQPGTSPPLLLPPSREQGQGHLHYGFQGSGGCHPDTVQPALQLLL